MAGNAYRINTVSPFLNRPFLAVFKPQRRTSEYRSSWVAVSPISYSFRYICYVINAVVQDAPPTLKSLYCSFRQAEDQRSKTCCILCQNFLISSNQFFVHKPDGQYQSCCSPFIVIKSGGAVAQQRYYMACRYSSDTRGLLWFLTCIQWDVNCFGNRFMMLRFRVQFRIQLLSDFETNVDKIGSVFTSRNGSKGFSNFFYSL